MNKYIFSGYKNKQEQARRNKRKYIKYLIARFTLVNIRV